MKDCLFCKIAAGAVEADIVYRDDEVTAFRDINPQAPVHIVIIPRKHIERSSDLTEKDIPLAGRLMETAARLAKDEGISEDGYRLVVNCNKNAGQVIFHLHMHLLGGRTFGWPPG